jgi:hypothetical protein
MLPLNQSSVFVMAIQVSPVSEQANKTSPARVDEGQHWIFQFTSPSPDIIGPTAYESSSAVPLQLEPRQVAALEVKAAFSVIIAGTLDLSKCLALANTDYRIRFVSIRPQESDRS